jgi:hypothetical protein
LAQRERTVRENNPLHFRHDYRREEILLTCDTHRVQSLVCESRKMLLHGTVKGQNTVSVPRSTFQTPSAEATTGP